jgi:hypothetical protein
VNSNKVTYETNPQFNRLQIESHISSGIEVNYFGPDSTHGEFVCVSSYDYKSKEEVKLFISGDALESFIKSMSVICALRFKNKGDSCQ